MKLALLVVGCLALGVAALEAALRLVFGFGNPPLYVADTQVGYRLAPHQRIRRFGNRILINRYSMRGPEITPLPTEDTLRILLLGDSIANGGWWTDQEAILSMQLQRQLQRELALAGAAAGPELAGKETVEVLNASANSWGPRNELAYLAKFGDFGSWGVIVLINTDDLFAIAPTSLPVGRDRNYPDRRPTLALQEIAHRLIKPRPSPELEALHQEDSDRVGVNLEALRQIKRLVQQTEGQMVLAMTPLLREVQSPGPRDYEIVARQRLLDLTTAEQIPYLDFLPSFQANSQPQGLYRDHIHLSPEGNELVSAALVQQVRSQIENHDSHWRSSPQGARPALKSDLATPPVLSDPAEDPWR
ncbi:SGNH/GDSL hydrolase family protein [Leptolyngbya sp. PCC 6406]|uniref:SGNH/GDSL hydrolase family protein n=1 Tax=Leptolyngbya sp. PCC 6406 TaxID=1173264 RepID=UPI0002ACD51A|nr:SGNH/GDSL hydrolase family protein [Leptolyngbya sp. PCC 6406]